MQTTSSAPARSHRPRAYTVFGAAFVAGAAAAFGVNSVLDSHLARSRPQVESETILVAIRALPAGAPLTVWDVALKAWPKAMVPSAAMRVSDPIDNLVVRQPLREGQPILAVQLERGEEDTGAAPPRPVTVVSNTPSTQPEADLWAPGEPSRIRTPQAPTRERQVAAPRVTTAPVIATPADTAPAVTSLSTTPPVATSPATAPPVVAPPVVSAPTTSADPAAAVAGVTDAPRREEPSAVAPGVIATVPAPKPSIEAPAALSLPPAATADAPPPSSAATALPAAPPASLPPATEPADRAAPRVVADARRPHPSSVQFLTVPPPEALEPDSTAPVGRRKPAVRPAETETATSVVEPRPSVESTAKTAPPAKAPRSAQRPVKAPAQKTSRPTGSRGYGRY